MCLLLLLPLARAFLWQPLRALTRQVVHIINQSIFLRCLWFVIEKRTHNLAKTIFSLDFDDLKVSRKWSSTSSFGKSLEFLAGNSNEFWRVNQMFDDEKLARTSFDRSNKTDSEYLTAVPIKSVQISAILSSSAFYKLLPISQLHSCKFTTVNYC